MWFFFSSNVIMIVWKQGSHGVSAAVNNTGLNLGLEWKYAFFSKLNNLVLITSPYKNVHVKAINRTQVSFHRKKKKYFCFGRETAFICVMEKACKKRKVMCRLKKFVPKNTTNLMYSSFKLNMIYINNVLQIVHLLRSWN